MGGWNYVFPDMRGRTVLRVVTWQHSMESHGKDQCTVGALTDTL